MLCEGAYEFDRVWKATDGCGRESAEKTQHITVLDTMKPTFTVPANDTICREHPSQAISADPLVTGEPTNHADNCTPVSTLEANTSYLDVDTSGTDNDLRVITREWTVTDDCGIFTTKTQYIAVRPAINDGNTTINCPANVDITMWYSACDTLLNVGRATVSTLVTDPAVAGHLHITATLDGVVIATDADGIARFPEGDNVVTWTVTDTCGFTVSCQQHVVVHFPPCGGSHTAQDYEGHVYPTVRIGCDCWTAENLVSRQYADDGSAVAAASPYQENAAYESDYGLLYSWYSTMRVPEGDNSAVPATATAPNGTEYVPGVCPDGWAVPSDAEFERLNVNGGGSEKLKTADARFWLPGSAGVPPVSGFEAKGAGYYDASIDRYVNLLAETYWWSATTGTTVIEGECFAMTHTCPEMLMEHKLKGHRVSVRCIQKR